MTCTRDLTIRQVMLKSEGNVSDGLNDGLNDLRNVFIFQDDQMIASGVLLEFSKIHLIGDECLASMQIDVKTVNKEQRQIVMAQMRNG